MFFKTYEGWKLEGAKSVTQTCSNCGNTTEHFVYVKPYGPHLGIIFMKKPLLSMKQYLLICPTCNFIAKELSKEQAKAMKGVNC